MGTTAKQNRTILRSDELSCPSCVKKIEKALRAMPGVFNATVHYAAGRVEVDHDPEQAPVESLVETVERA